jgi:hypothetical protein
MRENEVDEPLNWAVWRETGITGANEKELDERDAYGPQHDLKEEGTT